jgi:hypothetical protein
VTNGGSLLTDGANLQFNDIGADANTGGNLTLTGSVLKNNAVNASSDGSTTLQASGNWWGSLNAGTIAATVLGSVDYTGFLNYEPVLSPAARPVNGQYAWPTRDIQVEVTSRNGEEVRLSEDPSFTGAYFQTIQPVVPFQLSDVAGVKTVRIQFKSPTGALSSPITLDIEYVDQGPLLSQLNIADGQVISRPLDVSVSLTSVFGIQQVQALVGNQIIHTATTGTFTFRWDPRMTTDGNKVLSIVALDTAGNQLQINRNIVLALQPPPAPVISSR